MIDHWVLVKESKGLLDFRWPIFETQDVSSIEDVTGRKIVGV
jgi:hypothetical protein